MSTNEIFKPAWNLSLVATHPAAPNSGDPVRVGTLTGIAEVDEGDGGNISTTTSIYLGPGVYDLTVDDNEGSGIAVGDPIWYHDTGTGTGSVHLNNSSTGADAFFGYALETVSANATTLIRVRHADVGYTLVGAGAVGASSLSTALQGTADGLGTLKVARATFDPSADSAMRTVAAHGLGVTIPDKAVVVGGFQDCITGFTSANTNNGTVAISVQSANDIQAAAAVSGAPYSTTGLKAIVPKANTPESTGIKLTAAREVTATVGTSALTAGKLVVFLYYVISA